MSDPDRLPPSSAAECCHSYPILSPPATPSLEQLIRERIANSGPLRFDAFMASALYEPNLGYYASNTRQVGKGGDFFTSVSVGPVFGGLLARRMANEWRNLGKPSRWRIIECGGHDGILASDILTALANTEADAYAGLEYALIEPLTTLQEAQQERLTKFGPQVRFASHTDELSVDPLPGVIFGNELLDALPCQIVEYQHGRWMECRVTLTEGETLGWALHEIEDPRLMATLKPIGHAFPDGYRTEVRTSYRDFLAPLAQCLQTGTMIWIDYGFEREDYYHPGRRSGTLRTFCHHRAGEDPLVHPGTADITAHVDFTAVSEAAKSLGACKTLLQSQGTWLTELAREWLLSQENNPQASALRQFQTLTHPAQLGRSFQVIEMTWNNNDGICR